MFRKYRDFRHSILRLSIRTGIFTLSESDLVAPESSPASLHCDVLKDNT